jgi:tungstate transport system substrate-binding protein
MREGAAVDADACARLLGRRRACASLVVALLGCGTYGSDGVGRVPSELRVGAAYSLRDSGLPAGIAGEFQTRTQRPLAPTFVGTSDALATARAGLVDLLWIQSREHEDAFVAEGYGINRRDVMSGEYVIVGPPRDPAGIGGADSAVQALGLLSETGASFVSRGDESSMHARERSLWKLARVQPDPAWYSSLDAGMVPTLERASERGAYALADLATFLMHRERLELTIWVRGDPRLHTRFGAIAVNPMRVSGTDYGAAMAFIEFLTSVSGQAFIRDFGRERYGTALYQPLREARSDE